MGRHKKVVENLEEKATIQGEQSVIEPRIENLERANSAIYSRLEEFAERLRRLETPEIPKISVEIPKEIPITTVSEPHYPVPTDYQELVKTLLNSKFGVKIEPFSDRPQFMFTVLVPKEYSPLSVQEWNTSKGDLRSKVLNYADGINGVREWVTKVFDSFNPEAKAKIKLEI